MNHYNNKLIHIGKMRKAHTSIPNLRKNGRLLYSLGTLTFIMP